MIKKLVHTGIANVIERYGFVGDIVVNLLFEDVAENDYYFGVYYFWYEDEMYHIIAVYTNNGLDISLNNEIVRAIAE